jgi:hypothetical protein
MEKKIATGVRFLRRWRGREPGMVDRGLVHGVMVELVHRGIAVWDENPKSEIRNSKQIQNPKKK